MVFTANHLTDNVKNSLNTENDSEYSKKTTLWFSHLLQHMARKWDGLILQHSRAHTGNYIFMNVTESLYTVFRKKHPLMLSIISPW